jgi:hypothetical protein
MAVDMALRQKIRGLRKRSSLYQVLRKYLNIGADKGKKDSR